MKLLRLRCRPRVTAGDGSLPRQGAPGSPAACAFQWKRRLLKPTSANPTPTPGTPTSCAPAVPHTLQPEEREKQDPRAEGHKGSGSHEEGEAVEGKWKTLHDLRV